VSKSLPNAATRSARTDSGSALRPDISRTGLLFTSVGSIVGSGWLFGALFAAQIAGPAALIAWVLGGAIMLLLALIHAELGSTYPVAGGSARFPQYAFGGAAAFSGGWLAYLGALTTAPIEVEAILQYSSTYVHGLTRESSNVTVLTRNGLLLAVLLMLILSVVNVLGIKMMSESNKIAVWWKLAIPIVAAGIFLLNAPHLVNLTGGAGGFAPYGVKGVLTAITSGGIVFAFTGFEQAVQVGSESRRPGRDIPFAVIGSIIIGMVVYVLLQLAFLVALDPAALHHGWANVEFIGDGQTLGPFVGLALAGGLGWLSWILYADAVISPSATGLLYIGTGSRITYALAEDHYVPEGFARLSRGGVPVRAIVFSFICGTLLLLPFPGWQSLVGFISSATVLAYSTAAVSLGALRKQDPDRVRPYRLPAARVLGPLGFVLSSELVLWSGWGVVWKLIVAVMVGFVLFGGSAASSSDRGDHPAEWRHAMWLWPYLVGLGVISCLGSFGTSEKAFGLVSGPTSQLPYGWDMAATAALGLVTYYFALNVRLPAARTLHYVTKVQRATRTPSA